MRVLAIRGRNLASLEGEFSIDFTEEPLASAGIFAISGPTGAGKSTLLDAMCLALFSRTPRTELAKENNVRLRDVQEEVLPQSDPRFLLRRGTASGYAEVDFVALNGCRYRSRWSVSRARAFAQKLNMPLAIVDKRRQKANSSEVMNIIGDVRGKTCILYDDLVDTAGSLCNAAKALVEIGGAKEIYACATHGVLSGPAYDRIEASPIKEMVLLNTIPEVANTPSHKIKFLDVAPVFARAIGHIHGATSIADLF